MKNNNRAPLPGFLGGLEPLSRRGFLRTSVLAGAAFTTGCSFCSAAVRHRKPSNITASMTTKSR
jgi:anaerobic selenocysteine-containing dehydrogenase